MALDEAKRHFEEKERELKTSIADARDQLKFEFEEAMLRLKNLTEELGRYTEDLSSEVTVSFYNPLRSLLEDFTLREEQLSLARKSFTAAFTSGLDSNLYLESDVAKLVNAVVKADSEVLPEQVRVVTARLSEAQDAFDGVKTRLADLAKGLDEFLVDISLNKFALSLTKLNQIISGSETLVKEIEERIQSLRKER